LEALASLSGSFWVRLLYIHPDNFPFEILEFCKNDPRFLPYFDLPFQHASPRLLRAMNRSGGPGAYLRLIAAIRVALPDAVIRSTFLVGFPGETEEDFAALTAFQEAARLDWLGVFSYSHEEGTPAYAMKPRVPKKTALERKRIIEEAQIPISEKQMDRFVGRSLDLLVEEALAPSAEEGGERIYLGRLFCQAPEVDGAAVLLSESSLAPGSMVRCTALRRTGFDLTCGHTKV
jgi:ribosomal protein S12 methylthiotransferase